MHSIAKNSNLLRAKKKLFLKNKNSKIPFKVISMLVKKNKIKVKNFNLNLFLDRIRTSKRARFFYHLKVRYLLFNRIIFWFFIFYDIFFLNFLKFIFSLWMNVLISYIFLNFSFSHSVLINDGQYINFFKKKIFHHNILFFIFSSKNLYVSLVKPYIFFSTYKIRKPSIDWREFYAGHPFFRKNKLIKK